MNTGVAALTEVVAEILQVTDLTHKLIRRCGKTDVTFYEVLQMFIFLWPIKCFEQFYLCR